MAKVVVTASADADLANIIADLAGKGAINAALHYAAEFETFLDRLSDFPGSGPPRPKLGAHARIGIISPYVIIYDYVDDTVVVLRVLHGRRNITKRLLPGR